MLESAVPKPEPTDLQPDLTQLGIVKLEVGSGWELIFQMTDTLYDSNGRTYNDPSSPVLVGQATNAHFRRGGKAYSVRIHMDSRVGAPDPYMSVLDIDTRRNATQKAMREIVETAAMIWHGWVRDERIMRLAVSQWADFEISEAKAKISVLEDKQRALKTRITQILGAKARCLMP